MSSRTLRSGVLLGVVLASCLACEKEIHRASRQEFQELLARNLPQDQQAQALEAFVQAYPEPKTNPNLVRAFGMLADYHARAGHPDLAAAWYERAVRLHPDDPDLLNALGYHYALNRMNLDRAVTALETAVRLAEENHSPERRLGFIKDSLGWAYRMRGDLPLAVAILEEAVRLAPGVAIIQEHLAETYHAIGERDKAAALYLELYLKGRGVSAALRESLRVIGREGGRPYSRELEKRVASGLKALIETERRRTAAEGATLVEIVAADGQRLYGSLYRPEDRDPRGQPHASSITGGVLLLHPLGSNRGACAPVARALASRRLLALTLDLRGHGASVSESCPDSRDFAEHLADRLRAAEQDVSLAFGFLSRQSGADPRRLAVVGAGLGAYLAARTGSHDRRAPGPAAIVLLSPWGSVNAYRDPLSRSPADAVLAAAGDSESAPLELVQALTAPGARPAPRAIILKGPGTGFELLATGTESRDGIIQFLEARLAVPPTSRTGASVF